MTQRLRDAVTAAMMIGRFGDLQSAARAGNLSRRGFLQAASALGVASLLVDRAAGEIFDERERLPAVKNSYINAHDRERRKLGAGPSHFGDGE